MKHTMLGMMTIMKQKKKKVRITQTLCHHVIQQYRSSHLTILEDKESIKIARLSLKHNYSTTHV